MSLFRPLAAETVDALVTEIPPPASSRELPSAPSTRPTLSPLADVGGDDLFEPPPVRYGADDALRSAGERGYGLDDEDDFDEDEAGLHALDDLGEWAAGGRSAARVNLTARLRPRNNANNGHSRAVDRLQRAEDKRREHVARDKLDRATVEQVLDPRTRMILFRLLSRGRLRSVDGCVSTGKEANVYYGTAPPGCVDCADKAVDVDVAVKVFKTAILSFKDRERYVAGEFRFRRGGYNRQSNRKMVQQWTEKEYRNLTRLNEAGVPTPTPYIIKPPILVMEFFGRDGWPAPRLKDANLSIERLTAVYSEMCVLMRRMFQRAKLVHGDLSEYNILYHGRRVVIIDVSQSVEDDHPMALDFLRRDCVNINQFFSRGGVATVLGLRELYDFITEVMVVEEKPDLSEREIRAQEDEATWTLLNAALSNAQGRTSEDQAVVEADDVVFNQSFIPRTLDDIYNGDTNMQHAHARDPDTRRLYAKLSGVAADESKCPSGVVESASANVEGLPGRAATDTTGGNCSVQGGEESKVGSTDSGDGSSSSGGSDWESDAGLTAEEAKAARREHKKAVKAEARERREQKTPKHVKKRKDALAKRRRHVKTKK